MSKKRNRTIAREIVRSEAISDNSIIMLKSATPLATELGVEILGNAVAQKYNGCLIVVVDEFDDLSILNEREMNRLGWVRQIPNVDTSREPDETSV